MLGFGCSKLHLNQRHHFMFLYGISVIIKKDNTCLNLFELVEFA